MPEPGPDLRQVNGKWEHFDVFHADPKGEIADVSKYLANQGWNHIMVIGDPDATLSLDVWQRHRESGHPEYLLEVNSSATSMSMPYLVLDSLPDLMDLVARWAPAVQTAAVTEVLRDLQTGMATPAGIVETVAARIMYGINEVSPRLPRKS
jgi:hypothetical protein